MSIAFSLGVLLPLLGVATKVKPRLLAVVGCVIALGVWLGLVVTSPGRDPDASRLQYAIVWGAVGVAWQATWMAALGLALLVTSKEGWAASTRRKDSRLGERPLT